MVSEGRITELDDAAKEEAADAVRFAQESEFPQESDIFQDVYYEVDRQTVAGRTGKHFFNG